MRCLQKIVQNGNSSQVTLPRPLMFWLGWLPGEAIIVEALEDKSVRIRRPARDEFLPKNPPKIVLDSEFPDSK